MVGISLSLYAGMAIQRPSRPYDGNWWLSISATERIGFVNGYFDCYTYEYKGRDNFSKPRATYADSISGFYERRQASERSKAVSEVLSQFRDAPGRPAIDKYAQPARGPHGGDDGLYWRQMSAREGPELRQLGFIEGYLSCHVELSGNKRAMFSKPPADYVTLISEWYGFHRDTDDIDARRESSAIADVLYKFRDRPAGSKGR